MDAKLIFLIIIAVLGLFLLEKGITGFTIMSQTCCFPSEDCDPQDMCDFVKPEYKSELGLDFLSTLAGAVMFISSLVLTHKHLHKKRIK